MQFAMSYEIPSSTGNSAIMPTTLEALTKFRMLYRPDQSGKTVASCRQIASILLCALKRELVRPIETQDARFVVELLKDLTKYRHPDSFPVLEKIAREHPVRCVRELATAMTYQMSNSLEKLWAETLMDPEANVTQRLTKLRAARNLPLSPVQLVEVIFCESKALSLRSGYEEISQELREYFKHSDELVKLAACWVVVKDWAISEQKLLREAVFVLADLAVNAADLGTSNDAFQLLKQVRTLSPFADSMVKHAELEANHRFLQVNMACHSSAKPACIAPIAVGPESVSARSQAAQPASFAVPEAQAPEERECATASLATVSPIALSKTSFFQRYSA